MFAGCLFDARDLPKCEVLQHPTQQHRFDKAESNVFEYQSAVDFLLGRADLQSPSVLEIFALEIPIEDEKLVKYLINLGVYKPAPAYVADTD